MTFFVLWKICPDACENSISAYFFLNNCLELSGLDVWAAERGWSSEQCGYGQFPILYHWLHHWKLCFKGKKRVSTHCKGTSLLPLSLWVGASWGSAGLSWSMLWTLSLCHCHLSIPAPLRHGSESSKHRWDAAPSLLYTFIINTTAVTVWFLLHCCLLSVNCYLNP